MRGASVELVKVTKRYPNGAVAVDGIDLRIPAGSYCCLLGPSGCGKTTMLNIMSGLLVPSQGRVLFDGRDVTRASPQERNIAQVFQFPVVYDTMTVRQNLAFPLRNRGVPAAQIAARVDAIARMIGMETQLDRRARGLTADAKQKISLGRGMVRQDVNAILFDEPPDTDHALHKRGAGACRTGPCRDGAGGAGHRLRRLPRRQALQKFHNGQVERQIVRHQVLLR